MKKIVAISMVKNEMDIIESFVRHTLGFADLLIIADHKSTDRTREILEALQAEGLPIIIEDVAAARHMQAETMTHLLWEAADDYGADLILPLDADEFLVPAGRAPVRDVLNMVPIDDVRSLLWRRCIPVSEDGISSGKFALSVPLLQASSPEKEPKLIVSGELVRREHIRLSEGNHLILRKIGAALLSYCGNLCKGLELVHLYWRSPAQIRSKFAVGWPNIAGKYGIDTQSGGGYRELFSRIRHGERLRKEEGTDNWEPCSLCDGLSLPDLRYSADTMPDVLANVMAASEALAEELAETRALASHLLVTTIVPYLEGEQLYCEDKKFRRTLSSATAEDYPWREIIVPVIASSVPELIQKEVAEAGGRLVAGRTEFLEAVRGKYVEWLLPGETVYPEKLRRMVTFAELQDEAYSLVLSGSRENPSTKWPYVNLRASASANMQPMSFASLWHYLLLTGAVPSHGFAGLLMRREAVSSSSGLLQGFADGRFHLLSMWRELLLSGTPEQQRIGILHDAFVGLAEKPRLEEVAAHQLDWHALCLKDRALLSEEEQKDILDRQRRIGIYLLEHAIADGLDLQSGIWPAYQQMLTAL